MALHKTDYGLVYNDDGSLRVTKRTDDVPFAGTTAWAVESGTTNIYSIKPYESYTGIISIQTVDAEQNYWRITLATTSFAHFIWASYTNTYNNLSVTYWARVVSGDPLTMKAYIRGDAYNNLGDTSLDVVVDKTWTKLSASADVSACSTIDRHTWMAKNPTGQVIEVKQLMVEDKPFSTSYVPSTRSQGKLYIPLKKLPFNPQTDNFVISYWKKPTGTHNDTLNGLNICGIGNAGNGYTK